MSGKVRGELHCPVMTLVANVLALAAVGVGMPVQLVAAEPEWNLGAFGVHAEMKTLCHEPPRRIGVAPLQCLLGDAKPAAGQVLYSTQ